ncbi:MAG TPA: DinB family protein [Candidatus Elarobacter sp.]|nr:DinB family protein [Candidatus Elarobacter sp.]
MTIAEILLPEFDHEMKVTRTLLERVPDDRADWRPHAKSFTFGELAAHLANIPTWAPSILGNDVYDLGAPDADPSPVAQPAARMLANFDQNVLAARAAIANASDSEMMKPWTLRNGATTFFTLPRAAVLRTFVLSHAIHHRGQLSVYVRMNDIPVPSIYGGSADSKM